jgi:hypothetical protein
VPAKVLSILALVVLCAWTAPMTIKEKNRMLDEVAARRYAVAWANKVHANIQDIKGNENGGFFGLLGSLGFEYLPKESVLAVRAYIFPRDAELTGKPDLLPFLNQIAVEEPESVSYGRFETCKAPWEPDKQPSLFLRIDIKEEGQTEAVVLSRLDKLRDDAMVWRRNKFTKALDTLRKKRQAQTH